MRKKVGVALLLVCLLVLAIRRSEPAVVPAVIVAPEPAQLALCSEAPPAEGEVAPDAPEASDRTEEFWDDTGGPMVLLDTRGDLRVEFVREDGTPEPSASIELVNCGRARQVEVGSTSRWRMQAGPCTLIAYRNDGRLQTPGQIARVAIAKDEETAVTFRFPVERTGGIGVVLGAMDDLAEVTDVVPGSAAEAAGLAPGDWILEIDGEDVADLSASEVAELLAGPEETPIRVTVLFEGDTGLVEQVVETVRGFLPADDTGG